MHRPYDATVSDAGSRIAFGLPQLLLQQEDLQRVQRTPGQDNVTGFHSLLRMLFASMKQTGEGRTFYLLATVDINLAYGGAMIVASPHLLVKALILHVESVQVIFQLNISCSDIFCIRFGQSYLPLQRMQLALCELLAHLFILILQESICKPSI